jgi:hypothetical protein
VSDCCEHGDEPLGSGATVLVINVVFKPHSMLLPAPSLTVSRTMTPTLDSCCMNICLCSPPLTHVFVCHASVCACDCFYDSLCASTLLVLVMWFV